MTLSRLLLGVCLFAVAVHPAVAQRRISGQMPTRRALARYGLERHWWSQATIDPGRDKVAHLVADEEVVVVQSTAGVVTTFDAETGRRLWSLQLGRRDQPGWPATTNDDLVLVITGLTIYALDKFDGEMVWQVRLPKAPSTSPAMDRYQIYVGTHDGSCYALDLRKIQELYNENLLPQWSYQTIKWRYKTAKRLTTPPVVAGRVVNFASQDKSLYSIGKFNREINFQFETDHPVAAPLAQSDGYLFIPTAKDYRLYCIAEENGRTIWDFVTGLPVRDKPIVVGDDLFVFQLNGGMFNISKHTGERRWWLDKINGFVAATSDRLYLSDHLRNVVILSRRDGARIGALPLRGFVNRISNERTDRLILATQSGLVVSLREAGREFPIYHRFPDRRPILPELTKEPRGAAQPMP